MMKKILALLMASVLVLALAACGGTAEPAETEEAEATETAETEATATATEEDGQNPIMNFIGPYASDRANILIEADGMEGAKVTASWADNAGETSEWTMTGSFDTNTLTIKYDNGTKTIRTFNEDGSVKSEEVVYTDGTGTLTFTEADGATKLTWNDDKEHVAEGMEFTFNF